MISITKSGRFRCLHCVGAPGCRKVPEEDHQHFECWGELMPSETQIDALCKHCFPEGPVAPRDEPEEVPEPSSSEDSSSSTSSSEGNRIEGDDMNSAE